VRAIEDLEDPDRLYDTAARFAHAVDLADKARRRWRKAGEPLVLELGNGTATVHPLVKVMQDAERDAKRFGEALEIKPRRKAHRGPDPVATIKASIGESPAAKLRRLKAVG
jgi:hypothetical protein